MNFQAIIKQTERQAKAKATIQKVVSKEKSAVLSEFSKDIFDYLLFIHKSPDFRFSAEPYWNKGDKTKALLEFMPDPKEKEPFHIRKAKEEINKIACTSFTTVGMSYSFGSVKIILVVYENFECEVSYETSYLNKTTRMDFKDKEEFVKSFTEFLIKHRKDV